MLQKKGANSADLVVLNLIIIIIILTICQVEYPPARVSSRKGLSICSCMLVSIQLFLMDSTVLCTELLLPC